MKFSKASTLKNIRFAFNGGKNHFYHSKLQTTTDGENWTDVPDATFERPKGSEEPIKVTGLNITGVTGVRLIATADNGDDLWLGIKASTSTRSRRRLSLRTRRPACSWRTSTPPTAAPRSR